MQSNTYKIAALLDKGVDFSSIFPEKQNVVKEMTGFNFDLANIVNFIKKETKDFTEQNPLALDVDKHIYAIYLKYAEKNGEKPSETQTQTTETSETSAADEKAETLEAISLLEELSLMQKGKEKKETLEAISLMRELLEME